MRRSQAAACATVLVSVGVISVLSTVLYLWALWVNDPLKSIGGFVPMVSLVLTLRVWRSLGWEMEGSWWGLGLLAVTVALVHLREHAILELVFSPSWSLFVPPHSLVAVMYAGGAVLLFGGIRLLRAAWFPVALMWLVNPVPNFFTLQVDLPLQHLSSMLARGFAHALGQPLTPDQLKLMFTPEFGMFIAPGCNGIRGAITMGFIALVAGYVYRFRPRVWLLVVAAAVGLGYVFNVVRLCTLVLYYLVALKIPWLQPRAEMGDYVLGACLFFVATALLFSAIQRLSPGGDLKPPALPQQPVGEAFQAGRFWQRWAALAVLLALGSVSYARALVAERERPRSEAVQAPRFPERVGEFKLQRQWDERLLTGALIFYWADYVYDGPGRAGVTAAAGDGQADGQAVVSVGVSPVLGAHDTLLCHAARGEDWLWHGELREATAGGEVEFSGSQYNDGATQYLEATTVCNGSRCGQSSTGQRHLGLIYSRPDTTALLTASPDRTIPVLLRTATPNTSLAPDAARAELSRNLQLFLSQAAVAGFTAPYR